MSSVRNSAGVARADDLLGAIAEHPLRARVEDRDRPLAVGRDDRVAGRGGQHAGQPVAARAHLRQQALDGEAGDRRHREDQQRAARRARRSSWSPPISAHGSASTTRRRGQRRSAAGAGAVQREPHGGQDHERREAPVGPSPAWRISADDAQVGEREPQLGGPAGADGGIAPATTISSDVSTHAIPNSSGSIEARPGSRTASGPATTASAEGDAGAAAGLLLAHRSAHDHASSAIRTATSDDDGELAPEQAALEALVGRSCARSRRSRHVPHRAGLLGLLPRASPRAAARPRTPRR